MCNKKNLPNRVKKANAAKLFAKVVWTDSEDRVSMVVVPGTEGKRYRVTLARPHGRLEAICDDITGDVPCQCISHARVPCYHVMTAVEIAAESKKRHVVWCANERDRENLNHIYHGEPFSVTMTATQSKMYGIAYG